MEHFINGKKNLALSLKKEKNLETWSNFEGKVVSPKLPNVSEYKIWTFVILHKMACQFLTYYCNMLIVTQYFQQFEVFPSFKNCSNLTLIFTFLWTITHNLEIHATAFFKSDELIDLISNKTRTLKSSILDFIPF